MIKIRLWAISALLFSAVSCGSVKDGDYTFRIISTNDVHGRYFCNSYTDLSTRPSLMSVSFYVDSLRTAEGNDNIVLIDAGDCLQGDNAAYYFNYVDTLSRHLYSRMTEYMDYDAVVVGNHDIETGHPVYDRLRKDMKVPFLAANAFHEGTSVPYFQDYTVIRRHGLKIAVIGFTNPNIKNWLSPSLWKGLEFRTLLPLVQEKVNEVRNKEKPDIVIVAAHTGTGRGDLKSPENQGLAMFNTLSGVDFVICAHDHRPYSAANDSIAIINSGSHCNNVGMGIINVSVKNGKIVSKSLSADVIPVKKNRIDSTMLAMFASDYEKVREFTLQPVGRLEVELKTRDAYTGMSDYLNLIHTLSLSCPEAQISFAAPLTFNGSVKSGQLVYNDLFTIYPFENQLYVLEMSGKEIKDYLEQSYDLWINKVSSPSDHVLKIFDQPDTRTGQKRWSFVNRAYNFDSAGGLVYTVDVTKGKGDRVIIKSLADGTPFKTDGSYNVAMTSYRASGGGGLMREGAGIDTDRIEERVKAFYPEIRELLYEYLKKYGTIDPEVIGNPDVIGKWSFIPEKTVSKSMERDMELLFGK